MRHVLEFFVQIVLVQQTTPVRALRQGKRQDENKDTLAGKNEKGSEMAQRRVGKFACCFVVLGAYPAAQLLSLSVQAAHCAGGATPGTFGRRSQRRGELHHYPYRSPPSKRRAWPPSIGAGLKRKQVDDPALGVGVLQVSGLSIHPAWSWAAARYRCSTARRSGVYYDRPPPPPTAFCLDGQRLIGRQTGAYWRRPAPKVTRNRREIFAKKLLFRWNTPSFGWGWINGAAPSSGAGVLQISVKTGTVL